MEKPESPGLARQGLKEAIVALGKKAFSPDSDDAAKLHGHEEFRALLER